MRDNLRAFIRAFGQTFGRLFKVRDLVFLLAVASVAYGIALIHLPAAFITVGMLFVILTTWGRFK